ncbi:hypothetical protein GYO_3163 [Bacillus spizizenii TU-B-10]|uniref:Uncharacterized protein n=1 Tax=Bacillus spizizenii (strain DSM 15029 / JCM 12233 / NBRC 101239 / NRRL B-23049 / TU-B-10) TaxID=1052585 RepID=G4NZ68_BACS4|nr:hypothetical protein GYO_3163 [Bacillus spizizenii TU-B-10]
MFHDFILAKAGYSDNSSFTSFLKEIKKLMTTLSFIAKRERLYQASLSLFLLR